MKYHLAIDIGASGGRHIIGYLKNGIIETEEIYRFENSIEKSGNSLVWNTERLFSEVMNGLRACREKGMIPETVAIDTWGVDYVLLDKNKKELLPAFCYRDGRTEKAIPETEKIISFEKLYSKSGIAKQSFNTVYQLYSDKTTGKLEKAHHLLMMPAYLSFRLTGEILNEYTICSTTAMVSPETKTWDNELLSTLGFEKEMLGKIVPSCTAVGQFKKEIEKKLGFSSAVVFCPSHDTASAVAACPLEKDAVFISSGTWSIIGTESEKAVLSAEARELGFANEGGIDYRFRFLKNYMGMWLLQSIRKDLNKSLSYDEMMLLAQKSKEHELIDVNAPQLVAPKSMIEAVKALAKKPDMPLEDVLSSVYHSLASSYGRAVREIEKVTGKTVTSIHIVGGGSKDSFLNKLTREYTGKPVFAGPTESTATGNLLAQFVFSKEFKSLDEAREKVRKSFNIREV